MDAVYLYPSAMGDPETDYPRIETGNAYTEDMNSGLVEKFNKQPFTQGSAILKINFFSTKNPIVQHIPIKEKVNRSEKNRMPIG